MDGNDEVVWRHLESAARVMDGCLDSLRARLGDEAYRAAANAIKGGWPVQIVTSLSLDGEKALSVHLTSPSGESVALGHVYFAAGAVLN